MRRHALWAAAVPAVLALAPAAAAPPHTEIDAHAVVRFDGGKVVALQLGWKFEPEHAATLARSYDADGDGTLSAAELAGLERDTFQVFAADDYLTHGFVDTTPLHWPRAEGFQVVAFADSLVYSFRLPLPEPVDPRRQRFRFSTYGEAHHVDIRVPGAGAIKLIGDGSEGCRAELGPDLENRLYGGVVVPTKVEIICRD